MTYLHIRGTLDENMVYHPRPGHESSRPRRLEGNPEFQLLLLDRGGRALLIVTPQVSPDGCGRVDDPLRYTMRGALPLHPDGAAYELRRGDICIYGAAIPPEPPVIKAPRCYNSANGLTLHWEPCKQESTHCDILPAAGEYATALGTPTPGITYSVVAAMESGRRLTVARRLTGTAHSIDVSLMPEHGKATLYLVASDGVRSSDVEAGSIDVPERPPTVHILAPAPDAHLPFGQPLSVLGCCLDMGGQPFAPERTSWSLDGECFATGTLIAALDGLNPGAHRLSFKWEGDPADRAETSVSLRIDEPDADYRQWETLIGESHPMEISQGRLDQPRAI